VWRRAQLKQLIAKNIEAEKPKADVDDLAGMVLTLFAGLHMEQNLGFRWTEIDRERRQPLELLSSRVSATVRHYLKTFAWTVTGNVITGNGNYGVLVADLSLANSSWHDQRHLRTVVSRSSLAHAAVLFVC
jgi:hypothetical protein